MITCREIADFLLAYVDGELEPERRAVFDDHIARCPCCGEYLKSYRRTSELGRQLLCDEEHDTQALPEELIQAVLAARRKDSGGS